ncbi:hypothetical protein [Helicobacter sp. 11S02629-2]|uniref:hypothetical protein n=1 Tax=Helicobacter sp. 11S02629-2 TaxID=1476195 RepID=UPI000BA5190B|nr:hypothetical protein [Helicobacter sp. 11S02629-2]PAF45690.1 hypothetical protein BKH40_02075 [Helicobacter sp. 11S02629-2]
MTYKNDLDFLNEEDLKVHLICKDPFLSISFSFYLKSILATLEDADLIISDMQKEELEKELSKDIEKTLEQSLSRQDTSYLQEDSDLKKPLPVCFIGKDILIPCSVYGIYMQLHEFYIKHQESFAKKEGLLQDKRSYGYALEGRASAKRSNDRELKQWHRLDSKLEDRVDSKVRQTKKSGFELGEVGSFNKEQKKLDIEKLKDIESLLENAKGEKSDHVNRLVEEFIEKLASIAKEDTKPKKN